nr:hypothetical protein [Bradyrhizobium jicamae]
MADRANTNLLQVLLRESWKDLFVYFVLAEGSLILSETKAPQPISNIHGGALSSRGHDRVTNTV